MLGVFGVVAAALAGCGHGDHERQADLARLFGASSAGKGGSAQGAEPLNEGSSGGSVSMGSQARGGAGRGSSATAAMSGGGTAGSQHGGQAGSAGTKPAAPRADGPAGSGGQRSGSTEASGAGGAPPSTSVQSTSCQPGLTAVNGACMCELAGTFALHARLPVNLASMGPVEALNDSMDFWAIAHHARDAEGNLSVSFTTCGQNTPDICASAQPPVLSAAEAYAQFIPVETWERPDNTPVELQVALPSALPGSEFAAGPFALVYGIALDDSLGAWPSSRKQVKGSADFSGSPVNGAHWLDGDGDGKPGITVRLVAPGGVTSTGESGPPQSYGATSAKCPRSNPQAARSPYAFLPLPQGLGVKRISALYSAQRMTLELHGALDSCDRISGMLTGPAGNKLKLEGVIGGCATMNGSTESDCSAALLDSATSGGGGTATGLDVSAGTFVLARVPEDAGCAQARQLELQ